ncbi:ubiquitin-conjugating enzyme E2 S [Brevipalpus obovatus]|uniref:ubiquitin-conjugating enzyme E2 S n=1 Tax=Brevipalpus obovatus TaxID=246614 RepID=UPI003D9DB169
MSANSSNVENLSPHVIRQVTKELNKLVGEPLEGIKVLINDEDVTNIEALIDGPASTPYSGGLFRIRLVLGQDFPSSPPKAYFITRVFHPNVSRSGEICVNTLKKDWKSDLGIKHILLTVKCLLIVPNPESALNEEAGKLLLEHYDDYCRRAKMMTEVHARAPREKKEEDQPTSSKAQETGSNNSNNSNTNTNSNSTSSEREPALKKQKTKSTTSSKDKKKTLKRL